MRKILTYILLLLVCTGIKAQTPQVENALIDAVLCFDEGKLAEARSILNVIAKMDSTNDAIHYYLGMCDFTENNFPSAQNHIERAYQLDSANTWYGNVLAHIYLNTNQTDKAGPLLLRLVDVYPQAYNTPYTLSLIGDSEARQWRDSVAISWYDRALELDPDYAPAEIGKAELYRMNGNYAPFFVSLDKVIHNETVNPSAKVNYLNALYNNMKPAFFRVWGDNLKNLVMECSDLHPFDISARELKLQLLYAMNDMQGVKDEAMHIAEIARAQNDTLEYAEALSTVGDIYYQEGDRKTAFLYYEKVIKVHPTYAPALNNYAYYLSEERKHLKKALKMSRITIEQEPDNATYLDTCAWILHLLHKDAEAKPMLKHAMVFGGRDSKVILGHYAEVLKALGEIELSNYYQGLANQK